MTLVCPVKAPRPSGEAGLGKSREGVSLAQKRVRAL